MYLIASSAMVSPTTLATNVPDCFLCNGVHSPPGNQCTWLPPLQWCPLLPWQPMYLIASSAMVSTADCLLGNGVYSPHGNQCTWLTPLQWCPLLHWQPMYLIASSAMVSTTPLATNVPDCFLCNGVHSPPGNQCIWLLPLQWCPLLPWQPMYLIASSAMVSTAPMATRFSCPGRITNP